jgi:predicted transposase/invertase (TIGR01784 family)
MPETLKTDHDQIFKTLFREFFKEFLEGFLPWVAEEVDFSSVEFLDQEFFTDINKGRKKLLDLVAKVKLRDGKEEFILLHTEFQASKPDSREFPERMFKYLCQLFLRFGKSVIPVVVFSDDRKWRKEVPDTYSMNFKGTEYLRFFYHSIKLKHYNWREFIQSGNPLIYALMAKMDYDKKEIVRLKADFLRLVLNAERNQVRRSLLVEFIENYVILKDRDLKEFNTLITTAPELKEIKKMVTVYEEKGMQKGMQKGMLEGRLETTRNAILEVLEVKFSAVPYLIKESVLNCSDLKKLRQAHRNAILLDDIDKFSL